MKAKSNAPVCVFCRRSGAGVLFAVFTPRFKPFGTACTDCERDLPQGTVLPSADEIEYNRELALRIRNIGGNGILPATSNP